MNSSSDPLVSPTTHSHIQALVGELGLDLNNWKLLNADMNANSLVNFRAPFRLIIGMSDGRARDTLASLVILSLT